jgi:hypothetical protein
MTAQLILRSKRLILARLVDDSRDKRDTIGSQIQGNRVGVPARLERPAGHARAVPSSPSTSPAPRLKRLLLYISQSRIFLHFPRLNTQALTTASVE